MSTYAVVEFEEDDGAAGGGVVVIRSTWFTPLRKQAFWPPYEEQHKFDRALRLGKKAERSSWKLYDISRVFYEKDDILKARRKFKEAQDTSNLESEDDNNGRRKRRAKARKLYDTSDDDSHNELPTPPPIKRANLNSSSFSQHRKESTKLSQSQTILNESMQIFCTPKSSNSAQQPLQCSNFKEIGSSIRSSAFAANVSTLHSNSLIQARTSTSDQLTLTDKLIALVSHVKEQNDQILAWINKQNNNNVNTTQFGKSDMPFSFLVETVDELDYLNDYINENNAKFTALALYLSSLGSNTVTSKTNRILKHIMSDEVASKFNYYGQRSQKRPFSDLPIKNLIVLKFLVPLYLVCFAII